MRISQLEQFPEASIAGAGAAPVKRGDLPQEAIDQLAAARGQAQPVDHPALRAPLPVVVRPTGPRRGGGYLAGPTEDANAEGGQDPMRHWLTDQEHAALSPAERNQGSLDRYMGSRKSPWELGRDYERYIGYVREQAGGKVTYRASSRGSTTSAAT
jgi:hypothetical protein